MMRSAPDLFAGSAVAAPARKKDLRQYQADAIQMLRQSLGRGNRRVVMQGATGFGKTLVASHIVEGALAKGNRVIFAVPAISLVDQTVTAFEAEGINHIGVMQAQHPRTDKTAPVQVASIATLGRRDVPEAALVIHDECHMRFAAMEALMDQRPDARFIGLSATPWAQGMGLIWDDLVVAATTADLIGKGYLSQFTAYAPHVPDLSGVKVRGGEYVESALADVMGDSQIIADVVTTWLEMGEGRPTLAFGVNCAHAHAMQRDFERAGVASAYIDAFTDGIERQFINRQFRAGEISVICSVRTMTTGVDLPVSCIIDAAPTKSEMLHVQKIGRGLRVNPGSEDCVILDHAGNSVRLGLVTDIGHDTLDSTKPGEKAEAKPRVKEPKPCSGCGVLFTGTICPACGSERKPAPGIAAGEGSLAAVGEKVRVPTKEEKQRFYSMALWLDMERNKGGRLAKGLYKGRFDVWPKGLQPIPTAPDAAFLNYEKASRIRYAKRMAKKEVAA